MKTKSYKLGSCYGDNHIHMCPWCYKDIKIDGSNSYTKEHEKVKECPKCKKLLVWNYEGGSFERGRMETLK